MSADNVEMVRRGYEAYARGDIDGAVADVAPDCRYTASGAVPGKIGVFEGPEGYKEFISWLRSEFDDADAQVDELIDAGDRVLVGATLTGRGKQSGIDARFTFWQVWIVKDGKLVHGEGFNNRESALEAAGLLE